MTTKEIENIAYNFFWKRGWYGVYEVAVPRAIIDKYHRERVDFLTYETTGIYRAYEIKRDKKDFYSGCAWSWIGHYNYFIMPKKLYDEVKDDIPNGIGVWVIYQYSNNSTGMECIKKPKKKELLCDSSEMMFAMMQAMSREYKKYRKILEKNKK